MHSLTSALDGGEWSDSGPGRFTPREREEPLETIGQGSGWAPDPFWTRWCHVLLRPTKPLNACGISVNYIYKPEPTTLNPGSLDPIS
jgi:hypothetical protein